MATFSRITPCLWFDRQGEEAAEFYVSIFPNSRITNIARYLEAGQEIHHMPPGSVMTVAFDLDGHPFTALNGGPLFKFSEAISFQINCTSQEEVDFYWDRLIAGGDPRAQQCGWLKDKFGVSWQVVPTGMYEILNHPDRARANRAMSTMLKMKKLDLNELQRAFNG